MPDDVAPLTAAAYADLLATAGRLPLRFRGVDGLDEQTAVEGYRWALSILHVGNLVWLWGDAQAPRFVPIVGPTLKWGGDNADAEYRYAAIDPRRTYRVTGTVGDAVYLSLTVYGGPSDGRYSTHIVGSVRPSPSESSFSFTLGPDPSCDVVFTEGCEAVAAITRDYRHALDGSPATWSIECVDGDRSGGGVLTDVEVSSRMRRVITWLEEQAAMVPVAPPCVNDVADPYPVPTQTFGWAAGDAAYAMGGYSLADDEALVVRGRSPACAFWNLCLWTPYLHTYDTSYGPVTINDGQVRYEADGSWTLVVAGRDPGPAWPNWLSTQGHRSGLLWFRWFLPESTPDRPRCEVVMLSSRTVR